MGCTVDQCRLDCRRYVSNEHWRLHGTDYIPACRYKAGPLVQFLLEYLNERNLSALYNLSSERRREINRYIKGIDITTQHLPNQRPHQLKRLDEQRPPSSSLLSEVVWKPTLR